jgi:N-acetylneuraminic acid mutarotase
MVKLQGITAPCLRRVFLGSAVVLTAFVALGQAPPSADTFVTSAAATANFGSSVSLVVSPGTTTYIRFNLAGIPAGTAISKATLRLYVDAVGQAGSFDVFELTDAWSESTLTYDTPAPVPRTSATRGHPIAITAASVNQFVLVDISALAQGWLNRSIPNNGVALVLMSPAGAFSFDSKESQLTANGPELEIVLRDSGAQGPPGPPGPQGPPGVPPANVAVTNAPNTFAGNQTVNGNLVLGSGGAVQFADGTTQSTASTSGVPSGFMILGNSPVPPSGYTLAGAMSSGDVWSVLGGPPTGRYALAAAAVNGNVYMVGGSSDYVPAFDALEVYHPTTNTWSTAAPMPTGRFALAAVAVNRKIYAIGGSYGSGPLSALEIYDSATDTWSTGAPMPTPRHGLAAAALDGKIYAIGGNTRSSNNFFDTYLTTVEVYDPRTNRWSPGADMPTGAYGLAAVAVNGKVYAIGGTSFGGRILNTVQVYDPIANSWTTASPMGTSRALLAADALNGKIYAIGGYSSSIDLNTVEVYDPTSNTWSGAASLQVATYDFAAADVNGLIYAICGIGGPYGVDGVGFIEQYAPPVTLYTFSKN